MNPRDASTAPRGRTWLSPGMRALVVAMGVTTLWHTHRVLGAALLAACRGRRRLSAWLAILGGLPSLLTLVECAAGVSLEIDELPMKSGDLAQYPGRIAPHAAVCLLLLAAALLSMARRHGGRWRTLGSPLPASVALGISAVSAGYLTGFATFCSCGTTEWASA